MTHLGVDFPPSALRALGAEEALLESAPSEWTRAEFTTRVRPHIPKLYRLCLMLSRDAAEAEDLLQNVLVKAFIHRGSFAERGSLASWLYGIVRHEHLEIARTMKRRRSLLESALYRFGDLLDGLTDGADARQTPERALIVQEEVGLLLHCLRQIKEPYRTVVHLCDVEDLGYDEVATILGVPVGTVKSRHARGRSKVRLAFEAATADETTNAAGGNAAAAGPAKAGH